VADKRISGITFFVKRFPIRVLTLFRIIWLSFRNLLLPPFGDIASGSAPPLVVSLTSYGSRIRWAHLAIESIIASGVRAPDMFLWLPNGSKIGNPLRRLVGRGLKVRYITDRRSHTKYCYLDQVQMETDTLGFLIADDDMIYPKDWYSTILQGARRNPNVPVVMFGVQTYLSDKIVTFSHSIPQTRLESAIQGLLFHPFSGSGLFVPKSVMAKVNKDPACFLESCPSSDDIWLHREFFRIGVSVVDLGGVSMPPSIPFVASQGLYRVNWIQGQNEVQLKEAFKDLELLR